MGYTTEELFENVKPGSKQDYALKQKFKECVECGWTDKDEFLHEDDIVCKPCYDEKFERMG